MRKILIIDDEVSFTWLLKMNLEDAGDYDVTVVNDPEDAVATARQIVPHIIILDLVMPGPQGDEIAVRLREDRDLKNVPIVFLTASGTYSKTDAETNEERGQLLGGHPVFVKPVNVDEVIEFLDDNFANY